MDLSVVVPVYNEVENLPLLFDKLKEELEGKGLEFEVILVDDGSSDKSRDFLRDQCKEDSSFRALFLARNFGQTAALSAGIQASNGEYIATLDGDLQNDPADILPLLELCRQEGYEVVSGWRKNRKDSFLRTYVSRIANRMASKVTGLMLHDYGCSMKVYRKDTLKRIKLYGEMHRFLPIFAFHKGAKVTERVVSHHPRVEGQSKYGYMRILRVMIDMLMFYFLFHSGKPLAFFARLGIFLAVTSAALFAAGYIQTQFLFLSLGSVLFTLAMGCVLFGLILELIIRTHYMAQGETQFVIEERCNFQEE